MGSATLEILETSIHYFFGFLDIIIFVRIILSWVPYNFRANPLFALIYTLTDPILLPFRQLLQKSPLGGRGMMLDFSPIFAVFVLQLLESLAISVVRFFV